MLVLRLPRHGEHVASKCRISALRTMKRRHVRRMTNRMDQFEKNRLSEEVRLYRHLYDTALKQHIDHVSSHNSWTEIGRTLRKEREFCKLRDGYVKA